MIPAADAYNPIQSSAGTLVRSRLQAGFQQAACNKV
jgi:hypothetical protein